MCIPKNKTVNFDLSVSSRRAFKAFPKIGKVSPKVTDECAPIVVMIRLRTLISRLRRQLLHLGEAFKSSTPPININLSTFIISSKKRGVKGYREKQGRTEWKMFGIDRGAQIIYNGSKSFEERFFMKKSLDFLVQSKFLP